MARRDMLFLYQTLNQLHRNLKLKMGTTKNRGLVLSVFVSGASKGQRAHGRVPRQEIRVIEADILITQKTGALIHRSLEGTTGK